MSIVSRITNCGWLRGICHFSDKSKYAKENNRIEQEADLRRIGKIDSRYSRILGLKDKYLGQRCFIVATGPSLTIADLELIKGEISFSMNSICHLYEKTLWRPTYYGIQDGFVYDKMKDTIHNYYSNLDNVLIADTIQCEGYIKFPFNSFYNRYDADRRKFWVKFSDNAYAEVYNGFTITYSLIQIAIYMGFKEIYLLGVDCSYKKGVKNHVVESGHIDKYDYLLNYKRMVISYECAEKYAKQNAISIINCTRGGMLEVFPRMKLEEVLNIN